MSAHTTGARRWSRPIAVLVTLALAMLTTGCGSLGGGKHFAAMFPTATGIYANSDVRILGVPVGKVDTVTPEGDLVRVAFHVDSDVQVPADAKAAVVAPTVVADRYIQLTPVYTGGPEMPDDTVIPKERTASPPEFDELLASAQKLSTALGPEGVNATGALSQAIATAARNLQGNGQQINTTLDNTSQAINTLSASRDNLSGTTTNLQSFTTNLKNDDAQVRAFTQQFAQVNDFLAGERKDLGDSLHELSGALGDVAKFVHDNRAEVRKNVDQLSDVLETINNERLALEQVLDTAPMGLDGLVNTYDAGVASLATRSDLLGVTLCLLEGALPPPLNMLFGAAVEVSFPGLGTECGALAAALGGASSPLSSELKTKLSDPKVIASVTEALRARSALPQGLPLSGPAPRSSLPLNGPGRGDGGPPLPLNPDSAPKTLGSLLGGGR